MFWFDGFGFAGEPADFDALLLVSLLPSPAAFAPASIAPLNAPRAALFNTSAVALTTPSTILFIFFLPERTFSPEPILHLKTKTI